MAAIKEVIIPDLGNVSSATVIELAVKAGDIVKTEQSLLTLESEKASMDIPAPYSGRVKEIKIKVGDSVASGQLVMMMAVEEDAPAQAQPSEQLLETTPTAAPSAAAEQRPAPAQVQKQQEVVVPDLGNISSAVVLEIAVQVGSEVKVDQTLVTLESEKASMDVPSPYAGRVEAIKVKVGATVSTGSVLMVMQVAGGEAETVVAAEQAAPATSAATSSSTPVSAAVSTTPATTALAQPSASSQLPGSDGSDGEVHAGPGVRRMARELGVDLAQVKATGPKNRILKTDVQQWVKAALTQSKAAPASSGGGLPTAPVVDFAQFGPIEAQNLSRIKRFTALNLHRNWLLVPHVTQFEEADITELEAFRKSQQPLAEKQGVKLTTLAFVMKAVVASLQAFPSFNASLSPNGEQLILKKYYHIGVAVDTPEGLVVPVIRDVDKKGLLALAQELGEISAKARKKALTPNDMQGSSFTISSLGGIGGTAFTPIVNLPDVAILGVSKAAIKPIYQHEQFVPRLMLPLSLSYDHRVIDGAEGARFIVHLAAGVSDIRRWLL